MTAALAMQDDDADRRPPCSRLSMDGTATVDLGPLSRVRTNATPPYYAGAVAGRDLAKIRPAPFLYSRVDFASPSVKVERRLPARRDFATRLRRVGLLA